jgi:ATP-dependent Clp protease ATP-binding subunit ClpB
VEKYVSDFFFGGGKVRAKFRPEFINRIDEFVVFEGLDKEQIRRIVKIQADRVAERLAARKVKMVLEDSAVDYLGVGFQTASYI